MKRINAERQHTLKTIHQHHLKGNIHVSISTQDSYAPP